MATKKPVNIMATKKPVKLKATKKPVNLKATQTAASPEVLNERLNPEPMTVSENSKFRYFKNKLTDITKNNPDWKRKLCAYVSSFCVGYIGGTLAAWVINAILAGSLVLGTSALISYAACFMVAAYVITKTLKYGRDFGYYILSGNIDQDWNILKQLVRNWFGSTPSVPA